MKNNMRSWKTVLALTVVAAASVATQATVVYDNSDPKNYLGDFYGSASEFGDQVKLTSSFPLERFVTTIKFEYYLAYNASGNEQVQFSLYSASGTDLNGGPGSLLYSSAPVSIVKTTDNYVQLDNVNIQVPNDVIWTVKFTGVDFAGGERAGLIFYNPPTVGSSANDFWEKNANGQWQAKNFIAGGGNVANFGAQIIAVPEPTTIQLGLLGGMAVLGMLGYRRVSK
jgi:hypothetical protein